MKSYYSNRIVAFVDILGFKKKVISSEKNAKCTKRIHEALSRIYNIESRNYSDGLFNGEALGIEVTTFSDSAVISYPAEKENLFLLIINLIHLQMDLVLEDVLIRGGITIGKLYHDKSVVYGPAMIKAYEIESKIAVYPRIVVDKDAITSYIKGVSGDSDAINCLFDLVKKDSDEQIYIDILNQSQEIYPEKRYYEWLTKVRNIILVGISNKDLYIKTKYQWLKDKFNYTVSIADEDYPYPYDVKYSLDDIKKVYSALYINED